MVQTREARGGASQEILSELILPVLAVALAIYYFRSVAGLPWIARAHGLVVGIAVLVLTAGLAGRLLVRVARGQATASLPGLVERLGLRRRERWGLVAWMGLLVAGVPALGFTASIFLFVVASAWTLGVRRRDHLALLGAVTALVGYLLFVAFLGVRLPMGPVDRWLGGLWGR